MAFAFALPATTEEHHLKVLVGHVGDVLGNSLASKPSEPTFTFPLTFTFPPTPEILPKVPPNTAGGLTRILSEFTFGIVDLGSKGLFCLFFFHANYVGVIVLLIP